ncbi:hypothetical protein TNCV_1040491 [Trichonephila clavipes]|nr:hypothetical protein TNCV_1040491 [Trichonephila clavipes]
MRRRWLHWRISQHRSSSLQLTSPAHRICLNASDNPSSVDVVRASAGLSSFRRRATGPLGTGGSKEGLLDPIKSSLSGPFRGPGSSPQAPNE